MIYTYKKHSLKTRILHMTLCIVLPQLFIHKGISGIHWLLVITGIAGGVALTYLADWFMKHKAKP